MNAMKIFPKTQNLISRNIFIRKSVQTARRTLSNEVYLFASNSKINCFSNKNCFTNYFIFDKGYCYLCCCCFYLFKDE